MMFSFKLMRIFFSAISHFSFFFPCFPPFLPDLIKNVIHVNHHEDDGRRHVLIVILMRHPFCTKLVFQIGKEIEIEMKMKIECTQRSLTLVISQINGLYRVSQKNARLRLEANNSSLEGAIGTCKIIFRFLRFSAFI